MFTPSEIFKLKTCFHGCTVASLRRHISLKFSLTFVFGILSLQTLGCPLYFSERSSIKMNEVWVQQRQLNFITVLSFSLSLQRKLISLENASLMFTARLSVST